MYEIMMVDGFIVNIMGIFFFIGLLLSCCTMLLMTVGPTGLTSELTTEGTMIGDDRQQ